MSTPDPQVAPRDNPYFGLEYYDEQFGAWFFGRETEGSKIITNLRAARLTLLHAESGVGKSSLLRAGVAWRMRKLADDMFARGRPVRSIPVVFTAWKDDPCRDLALFVGEAIQPYLAGRPRPTLPPDRLDLAIEQASEAVDGNLLIMLDQFEEYFLYRFREPVPERFADELARCINRTDLRANFLIAIREDAYAGLGDMFKGRIPNVYGNYLHIDYLDRASAERAIREPLAVYNNLREPAQQVGLEDELVETVLDDVRALGSHADGPPADANGHSDVRIATPLLQLVMERVWNAERAEGSHRLRLATLEKLRGVRMIVDAHLGKALDSLASAERQTAIDMFDHLVTPSGGKIAESVSDLASRTAHSEEQVSAVLAKLDHDRIVRPIPAAPGQDPMRFRRYEIFHDVLASSINRAIAARDEQRRVRRIRRFAALAVVLLVIVAMVAVSLAYFSIKANNEKLTAESRQLAAESLLNVGANSELSTQLALAALQLRRTPQAEEALRAALPGLQTVQTLHDGTTVITAGFDPMDETKVVSGDYNGVASIWDVRTRLRLGRLLYPGGERATGGAVAAFNSSGDRVAVGYGNGQVALFDARTRKMLQHSADDGSVPVNAIYFLGRTGLILLASQRNTAIWQPGSKCCTVLVNTPAYHVSQDPQNARQFVVTTTGGDAVLVTASGAGKPQQRPLEMGSATVSVNDAQFSQDGSKVVTALSDGTVNLYDLSSPGKPAATMSAGQPDALAVAFSPDGKQVVAGYSSGMALVWDVATGQPLTELVGNAGGVVATQFSRDSRKVVTASEDGTVRVWAARPQELRTEFTLPPGGTPGPATTVGYVGGRILAGDSLGYTGVFTAAGQQKAILSHNMYVMGWSNEGSKIATGDSNGNVTLWRAAGTGYVPVSVRSPVHVSQLYGLDVSVDGSRFVAVTGGFEIQVRNADTGQVLRTLGSNNYIYGFAIAPHGKQVIAGDDLGHVEVWDGTVTAPRMLGSSGPPIYDIVYNDSGSEFVTTSESGVVAIWNAHGHKPRISFDACPSPGTASFSSDGSRIVVTCGDGTVRVFEAASGRALTVIHPVTGGTVTQAVFSPDGQSIAVAVSTGNTGSVQVWNAELATPSVTKLQAIADHRVQQLTPAQVQHYLNGAAG
jgi:WD40 repeat protein